MVHSTISRSPIPIKNKSDALLDTARQTGLRSDWNCVLACPDFWSVRHADGIYSICNMTDHELKISILEDLSFVADEMMVTDVAYYPKFQAIRHLAELYDSQSFRVLLILRNLLAKKIIVETKDRRLIINDAFLVRMLLNQNENP